MKALLFMLACMVLTGCATISPRQEAKSALTDEHQYEPATASALAFDSPVAAAYPLPGLDRDAREPGAFIGYQESVTETYTIDMSDNQSNDPSQDIFNRTIFTEKVGTRYR